MHNLAFVFREVILSVNENAESYNVIYFLYINDYTIYLSFWIMFGQTQMIEFCSKLVTLRKL